MADAETDNIIRAEVIYSGYLIKSPPEHKSKDLGRWKKRFFRLWSSKVLEYYKSEKSKDNLKKPIDLRDCKSIDGYLHNKKWQHIFCVNTERRRYFLVADDEESMKTWLSNLCDVCGFKKQHSVDPERGRSPVRTPMREYKNSPHGSPSPASARQSPTVGTPPVPRPDQKNIPRYVQHDPPSSSAAKGETESPPELPQRYETMAAPKSEQLSATSYDTVPPPLPASRGSSDKSRLSPHSPNPSRPMSTPSRLTSNISGSPVPISTERSRLSGHTLQTDSAVPLPCYDKVPPPRPVRGPTGHRTSSQPDLANEKPEVKPESYTYDIVPPPRPARRQEDSSSQVPPSTIPRSKSFSESKNASKSPIFESYVDMQPARPHADSYVDMTASDTYIEMTLDTAHSDSYVDMKPEVSSAPSENYDIVPPPRPLTRALDEATDSNGLNDRYTTYDLVPPPRPSRDDEYMNFDVPVSPEASQVASSENYRTVPPIPEPTYSPYDTVPSVPSTPVRGLRQTPTYRASELYDVPPCRTASRPISDSIYDVPPSLALKSPDSGIYDVPPSVMSRSFEDFGLVAPDVRRSLKCKSASDLDRGHRPPPVDRTTRPTMMNRNTWGNTADIYDCPPRLDERRSADYSHSTLNDQVSGLSGRFENMSMKGTGPKRNSGESGFFESSNGSLPEAEQLYSNRPMGYPSDLSSTHDRSSIHYADVSFQKDEYQNFPSRDPKSNTNELTYYSAIDSEMTAAVHQARTFRENKE